MYQSFLIFYVLSCYGAILQIEFQITRPRLVYVYVMQSGCERSRSLIETKKVATN